MKEPLFFALAILMMPFTYVIRGWTITVLWAWFIAAPFGVRELSLALAIGISMLIHFTTKGYDLSYDALSDQKKLMYIVAITFISPPLVLGVAWIVKQFL